tara:strand:- start:120 stop:494 length:375 start_codon:yes stop_codon:yes gene_type:complete
LSFFVKKDKSNIDIGTTLSTTSEIQMSKNRIKYFESDSVLEEFYNALANADERKLKRVHIPRSDVFYVRRAYFEHTGNWESLDRIERCMYLEGHLRRKDVLDPDRKREWENDYEETVEQTKKQH